MLLLLLEDDEGLHAAQRLHPVLLQLCRVPSKGLLVQRFHKPVQRLLPDVLVPLLDDLPETLRVQLRVPHQFAGIVVRLLQVGHVVGARCQRQLVVARLIRFQGRYSHMD